MAGGAVEGEREGLQLQRLALLPMTQAVANLPARSTLDPALICAPRQVSGWPALPAPKTHSALRRQRTAGPV